jgi:hypothetical protein
MYKRTLVLHKKVHQKGLSIDHRCGLCDYVTASKKKLAKHEKAAHEKQKTGLGNSPRLKSRQSDDDDWDGDSDDFVRMSPKREVNPDTDQSAKLMRGEETKSEYATASSEKLPRHNEAAREKRINGRRSSPRMLKVSKFNIDENDDFVVGDVPMSPKKENTCPDQSVKLLPVEEAAMSEDVTTASNGKLGRHDKGVDKKQQTAGRRRSSPKLQEESHSRSNVDDADVNSDNVVQREVLMSPKKQDKLDNSQDPLAMFMPGGDTCGNVKKALNSRHVKSEAASPPAMFLSDEFDNGNKENCNISQVSAEKRKMPDFQESSAKKLKLEEIGAQDPNDGTDNAPLSTNRLDMQKKRKLDETKADDQDDAPLSALRQQNKKNKKTCLFCAFATTSKFVMKRHMEFVHPKPILELNCCDRLVPLPERRLDQERNDANQVRCPHCPAAFPCSSNLKRHIYAVHGKRGELSYSCSMCPRLFGNKQNLKWHFVDEHTALPVISVPIYSDGSNYSVHNYCVPGYKVPDNGVSNYTAPNYSVLNRRDDMGCASVLNTSVLNGKHTCHICLRSFNIKGSLVRHIKGVHDSVKDKKCTWCDYAVPTCRGSDLAIHVKRIHGGTRNEV